MTKQNLHRLQAAYLKHSTAKYPNLPYRATPDFSDKTTNGLTNTVIAFINYSGGQAERISSTGRVIHTGKPINGSCFGINSKGEGKYIPGTGTKGTADISATIDGRSVKIEIKFGKDRQSEAQKVYQANIEQAKGVYLIVRDFDTFIEWFDAFTINT
jgi:hypothetical protein